MGLGFALVEKALLHLLFDPRVVLRELVDLPTPHQVGARVTDMPDISLALVDGYARDGGPHAAPALVLDGSCVHAPVGEADGLVDQFVDAYDRLAGPDLVDVTAEALVEYLHGQLACHFSRCRSAHPVCDAKQGEFAVSDRELPHAVVVLVEGSDPPNV